jgi:hypothetical protein
MIRISLFGLVRTADLLTRNDSYNPLRRHDSFGPREMGIARSLKAQLVIEHPLHERETHPIL